MKSIKTYLIGIIVILLLSTSVCYSGETNKISKLASDIVLMNEAKVSTNVITTYIKNMDVIQNISTFDVIYLTTNGISDNIIQVLLNKSLDSKRLINRYIEREYYRESYDFFNNQYLVPRAKYYSQKNYGIRYHK